MARPTRQPLASLPFALWTDVALRTSEMLVASAQVIGHRTRRIAAAGHSPGLRDRREFARMGFEKVEAAGESLWAMGQHVLMANTQVWTRAWQDAVASTTAWMSCSGSRTLPQLLERQLEVAQALSQSARSAARLSDAAAHLVDKGLKPIHARATANARRLGR
ncbi:MAG TPA: polyhydroxyalkanoate granule-associated phasin [Albitalea sp.]